MGRRILAVLAAILALLWAAVPAYASSPAVDSAYLTREPWQNVSITEFRADGAMGYYQIYADTDNHCLYFAVSMQDQQVEPGANTAAVALNLQVSSAKFSTLRNLHLQPAQTRRCKATTALPAAAICRWKYWKTAAVMASQTAMPTLPLRWIKACAGR